MGELVEADDDMEAEVDSAEPQVGMSDERASFGGREVGRVPEPPPVSVSSSRLSPWLPPWFLVPSWLKFDPPPPPFPGVSN